MVGHAWEGLPNIYNIYINYFDYKDRTEPSCSNVNTQVKMYLQDTLYNKLTN